MAANRLAKKRSLGILNAKAKKKRKKLYRDLLKVTGDTVAMAENMVHARCDFAIRVQLLHFIRLAKMVINQTGRRVLQNETVPASEKVVSIFEEHTDIIIKDRRDVYYGHKICLTSGKSGLFLDCVVQILCLGLGGLSEFVDPGSAYDGVKDRGTWSKENQESRVDKCVPKNGKTDPVAVSGIFTVPFWSGMIVPLKSGRRQAADRSKNRCFRMGTSYSSRRPHRAQRHAPYLVRHQRPYDCHGEPELPNIPLPLAQTVFRPLQSR